MSWTEREAKRDRMSLSERGGEIAAVIGSALIALFFYAHQSWNTGFFTPSFGTTEAFFFYGSIIAGTAGPISRLVSGRRNKSRVPEIAVSVFWLAGSVWLFNVFPFSFAHFADVVPGFLQFLARWVTDEIARVVLAVMIAGYAVFAVVNAMLYLRVRSVMQRQRAM